MALEEVFVNGIAVDKEKNPVVLLKSENDSEVLPIWIGRAEASSILTALAGETFKRPMTHDLMRILVDVLGASVARVEITGIRENTYFARIVLHKNGEIFYVDARPSDSIALALRTKAPIYVESDMYKVHKRNLQSGHEDEDEVKKRLKELDPGEFGDLDF